ncbi:N-ethylmaleimide reductase [Sterolibacterium denitrificans]|uniref:N-ethylmaleimide reductase n=1 Tax=Sterolibacterium denitrificans TaxID=157592 RepID=A0A7Z7MTW3_9PROT|nr:alkene reductase [Sterolibacterium denitrificans]SMB21121.1 N-ethylmaleimide reductase [Sterolibacterium denitrificans]
MTTLFDPVQLGELSLRNRIVMAPMTRSRAAAGDVPTDLHVEYYRQRASAGLIVSEGTQPSPNGKGYCRTPGIHSAQQIAAWRAVTDAVHAAGGLMVMQVMHVGRIAHSLNKAADAETVAPSAIRAAGRMYTESGMQEFAMPRALRTEEIPALIDEYRQATSNALAAGFDGVELHATSGYLPAQFLSTGANRRSDAYGGSVENRIRFVVETLQAMIAAAGAGRVGIRICPGNPFNDLQDDDPAETFSALLQAITPMRLAYLHLVHLPALSVDGLKLVQENYRGNLIINDSLTLDKASRYIAEGTAAAASFGRYYVSNPDLVERFRRGAELADFDAATLYADGPRGYIDYPALAKT